VTNRNLTLQNVLIVVASYIFYGWWDWRFLSLIVFSTLIDYSVGLRLKDEANQLRRKVVLWVSIIVNLGFLGVFKYYNFFLDSLYEVAPGLQTVLGFNTLDIILPVGISFYTFQTLSYTIDVYKRKLEPTKSLIDFAAFVAFFPQLVAGPIERATNLLPQFYKKRTFDYASAVDGMRQILWGLFKKVVIADNCAVYANEIFNHSGDYTGSTLFMGALFFTFQIYGDFSGYSDIAIGTSRLFGFDLKQNFAFPYFSRDIAEFWRRWHISLSTWFRDYLYIPLGGSRGGTGMKVRNTFIIFIVSGFWHGANWTFIVWGVLNAVYFLPLLLTKNNRNHLDVVAQGSKLPTFKDVLKILLTFGLTVIAWIFFRAENVEHAINILQKVASYELFASIDPVIFREIKQRPITLNIPISFPVQELLFIVFLLMSFIIIEWFGRHQDFAIQKMNLFNRKPLRWSVYLVLILSIMLYSNGKEVQFIYFQF
jgi:D-alanyl-lipoteichoic acid acyltransferase DltB (MBOAT superfamily)